MDVPRYKLQSGVNFQGADSFKEKLLLNIFEHFNDQHLIDVTFKLANPTALVTAHALILSAASPYFSELFNTEKGLRPQIEITEIDSATFESLITYCYTGQIALSIENMEKMLKAALMLQLDDAVTKCADFLIENIPHYSFKRLYALDSEIQCAILNKTIFKYEVKNFMNIAQDGEFLNFEFSKLKKLLENDNLNVESEEDVFNIVNLWYQYDVSNREQHIPDLIACLRLTEFDEGFIMTNIHSLPGCQHLALEALKYDESASDGSNITLKYTKSREGPVVEFTNFDYDIRNRHFVLTDIDHDIWYSLTFFSRFSSIRHQLFRKVDDTQFAVVFYVAK